MKLFSSLPLLGCLPFSADTHIIFDDVGSLAGAVSYTHLAINVDFTSIRTASSKVSLALDNFEHRIASHIIPNSPIHAAEHEKQYNHTFHQLINNRRTKLNRITQRLDDIQRALPAPRNRRDTGIKAIIGVAQAGKEVIELGKKISGLGLTSNLASILSQGVFGNFLSIFNPQQLGAIRNNFHNMIQSFTSHDEYLPDNDRVLKDVDNTYQFTATLQALASESDFNLAFDAIERSLNDVATAMQEAQHQRLAIELLPLDELQRVYHQLHKVAAETGTEMLITAPAHLFQLEASFLYDGESAAILVHVPMIPPGTLASLYQLRPFPIPLGGDNILLPKETPELLAISNTDTNQWSILQHYQLSSCSKINSVYVCPNQGILRTPVEATCVGALYKQRIDIAKNLCDMDIMPEYELAVPLHSGIYLIYATHKQSASLSCPNQKLVDRSIPHGVSQQEIPEGCHLDMDQTVVHSQFNLRIAANIRYYKWDNVTIQEFGISSSDINEARSVLAPAKRGTVALSKVIESQKKWYQRKDVRSIAIAAAAGAVACLALTVIAIGIFVRYALSSRRNETILGAEFERVKDFVERKLGTISVELEKKKVPSPPTSPIGSPCSHDKAISHLDDELAHRLQDLKNSST